MDIRHGRHCVFKLHAHLVFVTKYRRSVLTDEAFPLMRRHFDKVCSDFASSLVGMDGGDDHVHLLVEYPPHTQLSKLVNSLKGVSSRMLRKEMPEVSAGYYKGALWAPSYFAASCGGAPLDIVKLYIEQQRVK